MSPIPQRARPDQASTRSPRDWKPLRLAPAHGRREPLPRTTWSARSVSDRLADACRGRTPQSLARLSGASEYAVRRYLRGSTPPPSYLVRISVGLGLSLNWLLTGRGPARRTEVRDLALDRASTGELVAELALRAERAAGKS